MILRSIDVSDIHTTETAAMFGSKISNYKDILKHIQIGQSITTNEHFDWNFLGFTSKWKIMFYPKGQYDFGVSSNDSRVYIQLISMSDRRELKVNIKIVLISGSVRSASASDNVSVFNVDHSSNKNWAGPFCMRSFEEDTDSLTIKCMFKIMPNGHKETLNCKRSLREIDSSSPPPPSHDNQFHPSSSKKTRSLSPPTIDKDKSIPEQNCKVNEVETSPKNPPNPFKNKSPITYSRLTQYRPNNGNSRNHNLQEGPPNPFKNKSPITYSKLTQYRTHNGNSRNHNLQQNCDKKEPSVNDPRSKFKYKHPRSPEERCARKEYTKLSISCHKLTLNRNEDSAFQKLKSETTASSQCLKVSDLFKKDVDTADTQSQSDLLTEDEDTPANSQTSHLEEKIQYFESLSK